MATEYIESKKLWKAPPLLLPENGLCGLGELILAKLKTSDPERIVEINDDNGVELKVKDLYYQTILVASNLLRLGVKKGDHVVVYSRTNERITPITFACYTIGAPINFFDLNFVGENISQYLDLINPTVIIFEELFRTNLFTALDHSKLSKLKCLIDIYSQNSKNDSLFHPMADLESFQPPNIGDPTKLPAFLLFTSGSTALPKVAMQSHAMVIQGVYNKWWELETENIICTLCDLRWIDQAELMLQPVFFGVKRVFTSKRNCEISGEDAAQIIRRHKVSHFDQLPMLYLEMLKSVEESKNISCLNSLKVAILGGEIVTSSLVSFSNKLLPDCKIVKYYGLTEISGLVATDEFLIGNHINGGALKNGFLVRIINETSEPLGPNEKGQLLLKSTYMTLGYFNNEKANKQAFSDDGWYKTGDFAFMDSGNLLNIVTRCKFLLRSGGKTISPNEVENIVNSHPAVLVSSLVGHTDPNNPNDDIGTIFVVLRNQAALHQKQIKCFIRESLPQGTLEIVRYFKVIPSMPLTSCGKTNRKALKSMTSNAIRI